MSLHWFRRVHGQMEERRRRRERRSRHVLFSDWRWALGGRRRVARRNGEYAENGVDLYEPGLIALAILIFTLSCVDAALTLILVGMGVASEANPLMNALLRYDVQTFVNLKIVLTGGGVLFLVVLADSLLLQMVRVRRLLQAILVAYAAIVLMEITQLILIS